MSGVDRDFATTGPVDLVVELHDGHLAVDSADGNGCTVRIDGPRAEEFTVEQRGREIVIRPPRDRAWFSGNRHDVRVRVPSGSGLTTRTGSASVQARGSYGAVSAKCGSGDFLLDDAGDFALSAGSGLVRCGELSGGIRIKSGSGDVAVVATVGDGTISTGSGSVRIGTVARTQAVKTGSGDIEVGVSHGDLRVSTASGSVSVDRMARGAVGVRTASGDIRVGVMSGMPVWTDIVTATGSVESRLPPRGEPAPGQEFLTVRVQSASGNVLLVPVDAPATYGSGEGPQDASPQDAPTG
ncbi:MAG: DUF4097 family beta strand repeat-containing protein [Dermatophilaceae bacterium]